MASIRRQEEEQHQQHQPTKYIINKNPNSVLRRADSFAESPEHPGTPATNTSRGGRRKEPRVLHRPPYVFNIAQMEGDENGNEEEASRREESGFFKKTVRNYHS